MWLIHQGNDLLDTWLPKKIGPISFLGVDFFRKSLCEK